MPYGDRKKRVALSGCVATNLRNIGRSELEDLVIGGYWLMDLVIGGLEGQEELVGVERWVLLG